MARTFNFSIFLGYILISAFKTANTMIFEGKKSFHCRDNRFSIGSLFSAENVVLSGYVNKLMWSHSLIHCNQLCLAEPKWCVSVNFDTKVDKEKEKNLCELNHHGIKREEELLGNKFESRKGFIFSQIRPVKTAGSAGYCPCQNGGSCDNDCESLEVKCRCVEGFYGRNCEYIDDCQGITCQNGGTCQDLVNDFTCSCKPGYTGRFCENDIDECQGITCQNGGICQDLVKDFSCSCKPGYTGRFCEKNIDDCRGIACQNGGTCQDLVNDFSCSCVPGYTGRFCENDIDDCQRITCQNGGICQDLVNNFSCSCVPGYTGRFCENDIDECASTPCLNGGTCHNQVNSFTCTCPLTHHGNTCNKASTCDITYASYSINNVILYPWTKKAYAMTFCTWAQLNDSRSQYPASLTYSNRGLGIIYRTTGDILLRIDSRNVILSMGIKRDGNWQHLCIAWRNTDGKVSSYRNGKLIDNRLSFMRGGSIVGRGSLNICRRSDLGGAFIGKISNFNIWSSFLAANEIASMASCCKPLTSEGDLVSWSEVKIKRRDGAVSKTCPGTCYV